MRYQTLSFGSVSTVQQTTTRKRDRPACKYFFGLAIKNIVECEKYLIFPLNWVDTPEVYGSFTISYHSYSALKCVLIMSF